MPVLLGVVFGHQGAILGLEGHQDNAFLHDKYLRKLPNTYEYVRISTNQIFGRKCESVKNPVMDSTEWVCRVCFQSNLVSVMDAPLLMPRHHILSASMKGRGKH